MIKIPVSPADSNYAQLSYQQVTQICERLRAEVIADEWHGAGWRTDWAIMLTALDIAQYTGSLIIYLDVRTMAFASGVTAPTASKSLKRLRESLRLYLDREHWHDKETHHVNRTTGEVFARKHRVWTELPGEAYTYLVNPSYPRYVCKSFRFPSAPALVAAGADPDRPGTKDESLIRNDAGPLIRTMMKSGKTFTHSDVRSRLLLGRTELGVMLGPSRVAVVLVLTDTPMRVKDVASAARVSDSGTGKILKELAGMGLAGKSGNGWVRGMELSEYSARMRGTYQGYESGKGIVAKRVRRWEEERAEYHGGLQLDYDEFWMSQESEWVREEMSARYGSTVERV